MLQQVVIAWIVPLSPLPLSLERGFPVEVAVVVTEIVDVERLAVAGGLQGVEAARAQAGRTRRGRTRGTAAEGEAAGCVASLPVRDLRRLLRVELLGVR